MSAKPAPSNTKPDDRQNSEAPSLSATSSAREDAVPRDTIAARFGEGVRFSSATGAYSLQIRSRFQFRATENWVTTESESSSSEFLIRRARLDFAGNFFNQNWNYKIQLAISTLDMEPDRTVPLRDAYVTWSQLRDLNVRMGQSKDPFDRQRVTSSSALQMVDRSIVVDELNLDRDVGIQIFSNDFLRLGKLTYQAGIFGGDGRNRTPDAPGVLWVGRLQFQPFGKLDHLDDWTESDFEHSSDPRLTLAAGVARNTNTNRARSTFGNTYEFARFNYQHWEGDVVFKWNGWSLLGEVISRSANQPYLEAIQDGHLSREYSRSAWGYFVQPGYLFRNNVELASRYGTVRPMGLTDPALRAMKEIGPSISWYLRENQLKIQSDYFYLIGTENEDRNRHQLRLQMQVYF